jgi:Fe-S cluster biosynthesis and repair protein YggX
LEPSHPNPPSPPAGSPRLVRCARLGKELPGLPAPPFPNELGRRIYESISQEAWSQWVRHSPMVINEKGLKLANPADREALMRECEAFLFGGASQPPPGWVPPPGSVRITKK